MGRYSKEYYKENKKRILDYQILWKKKNKEKINKQRNARARELRILRSATPEDIERNIKLYSEGKDLDMSLRKLGPIFKNKVLSFQNYKPKPLKKINCKYCNSSFLTRYSQIYCSKDCRIKFFRKNFYQKYLKTIYKRNKERMNSDYEYMIKTRLRDRLRDAIRFFTKTGKIRQSKEYLDYKAIIKHLGPCPGKRSEYHIDHIIPLSNFNFFDEKEIIKAFAPENHQWLFAKDNLKKGSSLSLQESDKKFVSPEN